jgi:N6-L-threonylcarbamoyladenine synthase
MTGTKHSASRLVLGIESSCDDTAIAIMREDGTVLSHQCASQVKAHAAFGGVVPEIAARAHLQMLHKLLRAGMDEAKIGFSQLDAIAATTGPGLIGGVMVGAMAGKAIALSHQLPFIAINHLEAHALVVRAIEKVPFPYMLLLVSGGHCQIVQVQGVGRYQLIGSTRDDALGEAFDKCAKMLGLGYPGGPEIERQAALAKGELIDFPRPMAGRAHADFSFSGLKTAVRVYIESQTKTAALSPEMIANIAASFQRAAIDTVIDRLAYAFKTSPTKRLVIAGGVAANLAMREGLQNLCDRYDIAQHVAPINLCTDNGVMVAWAGIERLKLGLQDTLDAEIRARWPLEDLQA